MAEHQAKRKVELYEPFFKREVPQREAEMAANMFPVFSGRFVPERQNSLSALAQHAKADPEDVRKALMKMIENIPDAALENTLGAQITLVT
jgi:hypothetical protein